MRACDLAKHNCHLKTEVTIWLKRISELESLAIEPKRLNELNDDYEMEELVDNIKLNLYQEFKSSKI